MPETAVEAKPVNPEPVHKEIPGQDKAALTEEPKPLRRFDFEDSLMTVRVKIDSPADEIEAYGTLVRALFFAYERTQMMKIAAAQEQARIREANRVISNGSQGIKNKLLKIWK